MNVEKIYKDANAYLEGHFKLSSGYHSQFYLQSAKVLEDPKTAKVLAATLAKQIIDFGIHIDAICSPALGGIISGYALAEELGVRFIFAERVNTKMTIRRGFEVKKNENFLICEDIITTGGSALEAAKQIEQNGGNVVAYAALANRGFCTRVNSKLKRQDNCKLPLDKPLFALEDFIFDIYEPSNCPLCKEGKSEAYKPGSKNN